MEKVDDHKKFSFMEKIMLQHAYPPKLIIDCLGIVLGVYFLWNHQLLFALLSLIGLSILGNVVAWKQDINKLAETDLGRWMLQQANAFNLIVRTIGAIILAYGLWEHSTRIMILGFAVILLARLIPRFLKRSS